MKRLTYVVVLILMMSCTHDRTSNQSEKQIIDTATSFVSIKPDSILHLISDDVIIKNIRYSQECFNYEKPFQKFICKTTSIGDGKKYSRNRYYEKKEFFDFKLNKIFEIEVNNRRIELYDDYYITRDLFIEIPDYFELNNYNSKKSFVKCTGRLWAVEIPNTEEKAYFGYRSLKHFIPDSTKIIGAVYFSVNQTENYVLLVKAENSEVFESMHSFIGVSLLPNNKKDKITWNSELILWSKNEQNDKKNFTNFDLVLSIEFDLSEGNMENSSRNEHHIPIIDGLLFGKKMPNNQYEYIIRNKK